jgi:two-component system chemotaxis response regulator CheB
MSNRDIVAIGTSAGGVHALQFLAARLPASFPAALLITQHLSRTYPSQLDEILSAAGPLPAQFAADAAPIERGHIYIAPPDRHLLVFGDEISLGLGPPENHARPAIDPMMRSIARCCGFRAIGVVLTGGLADGASGLATLKAYGARTIVQDPKDASVAEMPFSALERMKPDHVVSLAEMPSLFERLIAQPVGTPIAPSSLLDFEVEAARTGRSEMSELDRIGKRSVLTCPECGGVMWEIKDGELSRFRCHVGHAYTAENVNSALDESVKRALASAARALEERVALSRKLAQEAARQGRNHLARSWAQQEHEAQHELKVIRNSILRLDQAGSATSAA